MLMAPVALTPVAYDLNAGHFDFVVWRRGVSSSILADLMPGSYLNVMGPTGAATKPQSSGVCLMLLDHLGLITAHLAAIKHQEAGAVVRVIAAIQPGIDCDKLAESYIQAGRLPYQDTKEVKRHLLVRLVWTRRKFADSYHWIYAGWLKPDIGVVIYYGLRPVGGLVQPWPMQCMLKACAQCLQCRRPQRASGPEAVYAVLHE